MKTKFKDIFFDFINVLSMIDAGMVVFLVAPPSGGKTTIVKLIEKWYKEHNPHVTILQLNRVSLLRLAKITKLINRRKAVILNDDFTTLASDTQLLQKFAEIIVMLSYDKRYVDPLYNINVIVQRLAFLTGIQPLWLNKYYDNSTWQTLLHEKIIRYYRLPIFYVKEHSSFGEIEEILNHVKIREKTKNAQYAKMIANALTTQVSFRANEYAKNIQLELSKYVKKSKWIEQFVKRLNFEKYIIEKEDISSPANILYREYTLLFFTLQSKNGLTYDDLAKLLRIRSYRDELTKQLISKLIGEAFMKEFVNIYQINRKNIVIPHARFRNLSWWWFKWQFRVE